MRSKCCPRVGGAGGSVKNDDGVGILTFFPLTLLSSHSCFVNYFPVFNPFTLFFTFLPFLLPTTSPTCSSASNPSIFPHLFLLPMINQWFGGEERIEGMVKFRLEEVSPYHCIEGSAPWTSLSLACLTVFTFPTYTNFYHVSKPHISVFMFI